MIPIAHAGSEQFDAIVARLLARGATDLDAVEPDVREILAGVRAGRDEAVCAFAERFEGRRPNPLFSRDYDGLGALSRLAPALREALELAATRISRYHEHQQQSGFRYQEDGIRLGMRVRPLARVGVYSPGGKARYPSSVLMAAIPARVAGVKDVILATPAPDDLIFAAAYLAGVTGILDAGGAQSIGALAYGTETVPRVDKIVGPGNRYVTCAKRLVFGDVGIDGLAGPSEILVLCDATADARWVAADLLSQAEHDEAAYALCVTTDGELAARVARAVSEQLAVLPRRKIATQSIDDNGAILVVGSREEMAALANSIAPEHLAIHTSEPDEMFEQVGAVGAAFVGAGTPEGAGDYLAGPSHVLPTGGAVRYGSPLGVYDFVARSSYIRYETGALAEHGRAIGVLARAEGLEGHARAVEERVSGPVGAQGDGRS
jgi:histidinol dehydrogenase